MRVLLHFFDMSWNGWSATNSFKKTTSEGSWTSVPLSRRSQKNTAWFTFKEQFHLYWSCTTRPQILILCLQCYTLNVSVCFCRDMVSSETWSKHALHGRAWRLLVLTTGLRHFSQEHLILFLLPPLIPSHQYLSCATVWLSSWYKLKKIVVCNSQDSWEHSARWLRF